jgi:uncharacterized protein YoxC
MPLATTQWIEPLMQIAAGARDTVITKAVVPERGLVEQIMTVCTMILTLSLTVLTIFAVPAAWRFRHTYKKINEFLDRMNGDIAPIMRHASTITDNVNYITTSVRADVQLVNATIASANDRLKQAVDLTERRLNEFNALLQVVQQEAEDAFVSTASTVRGVRTGAAVFRDHGLGARGMDLASDDEVDPADVAEELESQSESLEEGDGYDGDTQSESSAAAFSAAPRGRPRARGRRRGGRWEQP